MSLIGINMFLRDRSLSLESFVLYIQFAIIDALHLKRHKYIKCVYPLLLVLRLGLIVYFC